MRRLTSQKMTENRGLLTHPTPPVGVTIGGNPPFQVRNIEPLLFGCPSSSPTGSPKPHLVGIFTRGLRPAVVGIIAPFSTAGSRSPCPRRRARFGRRWRAWCNGGRFRPSYPAGGGGGGRLRLFKRELSLPVSTISKWRVTRSSNAVVIPGSPKSERSRRQQSEPGREPATRRRQGSW